MYTKECRIHFFCLTRQDAVGLPELSPHLSFPIRTFDLAEKSVMQPVQTGC